MNTKKYAALVVEINNFFNYFPVDVGIASTPEKLPTDELVDILEFGCPPTWQKEMIIQNFDVTAASISEFVDFCERLEMAKKIETLSKRQES